MNKVKAVVELLGEDLVISHIIQGDHSLKVKAAMITSLDNDGEISDEDAQIIQAQE
jgi:hypothetical protein